MPTTDLPRLVMGYIRDLPPGLAPLANAIADLATDLRWTWSHAGDAVWKTMDPLIWEQTENPFVVLQNLSQQRLQELDKDERFKQQLTRLADRHKTYCECPAWFGETHADADLKGVAYFSMEFGLADALPLYAGGLGVLAGDYLKGTSDLGVPVVGVGLLYQEGYFRQVLDHDGWQVEVYPNNDSNSLPIRPVRSHNGAWLHVSLEFPGRRLRLRVWEARVGRVSLYLLDSNDPLNSPTDRGITSQLYGGGHEMRLIQEIALGIGGWRVIEALGLEIDICHLNEGHAAFVTLERARSFMKNHNVDFWTALWATRVGNVFTTHTPVAAAFDTFAFGLLAKYGHDYARHIGLEADELMALGRRNSADNGEPFNMAYLAARTCGWINGVSELHGAVSRRIFRDLYPRWPEAELPITHITNGVHVPSWDSPWADEIWTEACGKQRWLGSPEPLADAIAKLDDEKVWTLCGQERADLVGHARRRLARQLGQRGADPAIIARAQEILDPNVLTLGLARRFTEYKRPNLLLHDPARLAQLLTNPERPLQLIVAGKAHPADDPGKRLVQQWARFVQRPDVRAHAVFLEDYDIALAQEIVQGVDVWLNTPRRPWEACGTSGMKVLANGGLNVSELDGWWAEAYSSDVGWALGDGQEHAEPHWDAVEAEQLYRLLEEDIVPAFYDRDTEGLPRAWIARMRASMSRLAPQFSTSRMVREYVEQIYLPAANAFRRRSANRGQCAAELRSWELELAHHWQDLHWGNIDVRQQTEGWSVEVQVYLGEVDPDDVQVQLYAEPSHPDEQACYTMERGANIPGAVNGYRYAATIATQRPASDFTPRIIAHHPHARVPGENHHILWWSR